MGYNIYIYVYSWAFVSQNIGFIYRFTMIDFENFPPKKQGESIDKVSQISIPMDMKIRNVYL